MVPMPACTRHLSLLQRGHARVRGRASAAFFSLLLVGLLAGCGEGGSGSSSGSSPAAPPITATQTVGIAGGTISLPDGKAVLTIPPAALSTDTAISITTVRNSGSAGAIYEFGPSGLIFNQPVTVTLSVDPSLLSAGSKIDDLVPVHVDDYLEILSDVQVDSANNKITGTTTHFSSIGLATSVKVGNISDFAKAATSFRVPIGDDGAGNDLGEDLALLYTTSTWTEFNYPKRSFNMGGAVSNRWYVITAFNKNRWLNNGWAEPSPRENDDTFGCDHPKSSSYGKKCDYTFHPGEDWGLRDGGNPGKPIHALADGLVLLNQQQTGAHSFGNILIIGHKLGDGQVIASFMHI